MTISTPLLDKVNSPTDLRKLPESDLETLAKELAELRRHLKSEAKTPEHDMAIGEVAKAEKAAQLKDHRAVSNSLAKADTYPSPKKIKLSSIDRELSLTSVVNGERSILY